MQARLKTWGGPKVFVYRAQLDQHRYGKPRPYELLGHTHPSGRSRDELIKFESKEMKRAGCTAVVFTDFEVYKISPTRHCLVFTLEARLAYLRDRRDSSEELGAGFGRAWLRPLGPSTLLGKGHIWFSPAREGVRQNETGKALVVGRQGLSGGWVVAAGLQMGCVCLSATLQPPGVEAINHVTSTHRRPRRLWICVAFRRHPVPFHDLLFFIFCHLLPSCIGLRNSVRL